MAYATYQPEGCLPNLKGYGTCGATASGACALPAPPKRRTPADIGRDIAAAEQRIRDLKAELSDVPPSVLVVSSYSGTKSLTLERRAYGAVIRQGDEPCWEYRGEAVDKLRDWLNYYFPKEA